MHWSTWKELCKPKSKGGIRFRRLVAFNRALLAKQVWRLIRFPRSLVAQILKAKYYCYKDIMDVKLSSSFIWRSILWGRELLREGLRWKVGDGKTVRVFHDAWVPSLPTGRMLQIPDGTEGLHVADFLLENCQWDKDKLEAFLLPIEVDEVLRIEKPIASVQDYRFWKYDQIGEYNVKSGYLVATDYFKGPDFCSIDLTSKWWKFVWSFDLPPRVRIFAWRVFRNIIPTEMNLLNHHVPIDGGCGVCRKNWGSTSHSLIFCERVRNRWLDFDFWSLLKRWEGKNITEIGEAMKVGVSRESFANWLMRMWLTWKDLCAAKHKDKSLMCIDLKKKCGVHLDAYVLARHQVALQVQILPNEGSKKWQRPKRGCYRLDVDYAVDEMSGRGGVGAIVRDDNGAIILAMTKPISKSVTILHGELQVLMFGICQCVEVELAPVEVFTDSLLAVHVIAERNAADSILGEEFFNFFIEVQELHVLSISDVRREANMAAHNLASLAKSLDSTSVWFDNWPSWLLDIVRSDYS